LEMTAEALNARAAQNAHLAKEMEQYHHLNRAIHRAETDIEPCSDEHLGQMKRERLALLDRLRHELAEA
ncbi:MAG: DUF465 domain-containing protein, partial [Pseudomonadota bacterium]